MTIRDVIIFGAEGLAKDTYGVISENNGTTYDIIDVIGFVDDINYNRDLFGIPVKNNIKEFHKKEFYKSKKYKPYIILAIGDPKSKEDIKLRLDKDGIYQFTNIIHKNTYINKLSVVGTGNIIMGNVTLSGNVKIGNHICIYSQSNISHDAAIGDYCTISPGATICGNVTIGKRCFIGAGTIIKEKVSITNNVFIGAGSLVLEHINKEGLYYGSPAKFQKAIENKKLI